MVPILYVVNFFFLMVESLLFIGAGAGAGVGAGAGEKNIWSRPKTDRLHNTGKR